VISPKAQERAVSRFPIGINAPGKTKDTRAPRPKWAKNINKNWKKKSVRIILEPGSKKFIRKEKRKKNKKKKKKGEKKKK